MAEFLTTSGTSHWVENIIIDSEKQLILISPYLKLSKTFYERLLDASHRGVKIIFIYGKDELKPEEKKSLLNLKNLDLYYFENLHAKCYLNENYMIITSMNMHEFSEKNNREMGVLVKRDIDVELYKNGYKEAMSIKEHSQILDYRKYQSSYTYREKKEENGKTIYYDRKNALPTRGFCIRCSTRLYYNPSRPYCDSCYSSWAYYENPNFSENVCHGCGEYVYSSMNKPLCHNCFKVYENLSR